jgi:PEP-CTERM motif
MNKQLNRPHNICTFTDKTIIYGAITLTALLIATNDASAQSILIDFGPDGVSNVNGATTASPDVNGNYWNNMDSPNSVANGLSVMNLVTANDTATTVGVKITSSTWLSNGTAQGGLLNPDPSLLGIFAIPTVTEDYFFIQTSGTTGTLQINGLDPGLTYNLSMFGTRTTSATDTRNSIYSVTDVNGLHTVTLQTSGPGAGTAANPYGNNATIPTLNNLVPNASGDINFTLAIGANSGSNYAYLGALEITAVPEPTTMALAGLGGLAMLLVVRRRRA